MARALHANGANVVLSDIQGALAQQVADELDPSAQTTLAVAGQEEAGIS